VRAVEQPDRNWENNISEGSPADSYEKMPERYAPAAQQTDELMGTLRADCEQHEQKEEIDTEPWVLQKLL